MTRTIRQKTVLRDSGLLHALLGIETADDLYGHPVVGASWEGFVIEQLIGCIDDPSVESSFYRTVAGAELDLIFSSSTGKQAFEIKLGLSPTPKAITSRWPIWTLQWARLSIPAPRATEWQGTQRSAV